MGPIYVWELPPTDADWIYAAAAKAAQEARDAARDRFGMPHDITICTITPGGKMLLAATYSATPFDHFAYGPAREALGAALDKKAMK